MKVVVGCPVRQRAWILDAWFQHVENTVGAAADVEPVYAFVVDPTDDSYPIIERIAQFREVHVALVDEAPIAAGALRGWKDETRLQHMVEVRNHLLGVVRELSPDLFWSLDSDILVPPGALQSAVELMDAGGYAAVGTLTWMMATGMEWPNHGVWDRAHGGLRRFPTSPGAQHATTILMAAKLMAAAAYSVDYVYHSEGEDIGWSLACRDKGLAFAIDGAHPAKHVMSQERMDRVDARLGW